MHPLAKLIITTRALVIYALAALLAVWVLYPRLVRAEVARSTGVDIDLSRGAAERLGMISVGRALVGVANLGRPAR